MMINRILNKYPDKKIPSKNLGIMLNEEKIDISGVKLNKVKIELCYVDSEMAYNFAQDKIIDKSEATPINALYKPVKKPDNDFLGDKITILSSNRHDPIIGMLSEKSIYLLSKLSFYSQDIEWYNEEEGIKVVKTDFDKKIDLKSIIKIQDKINKLEAARQTKVHNKIAKLAKETHKKSKIVR